MRSDAPYLGVTSIRQSKKCKNRQEVLTVNTATKKRLGYAVVSVTGQREYEIEREGRSIEEEAVRLEWRLDQKGRHSARSTNMKRKERKWVRGGKIYHPRFQNLLSDMRPEKEKKQYGFFIAEENWSGSYWCVSNAEPVVTWRSRGIPGAEYMNTHTTDSLDAAPITPFTPFDPSWKIYAHKPLILCYVLTKILNSPKTIQELCRRHLCVSCSCSIMSKKMGLESINPQHPSNIYHTCNPPLVGCTVKHSSLRSGFYFEVFQK